MIQNLKDNLKIVIIKARLRRALRPDRSFIHSARDKFLRSIVSKESPTQTHAHYSFRWSYALIVAIAVFGLTGGVATFADVKDVPVDHPLYQFKRVSEDIRVALAPNYKKMELHAKLANRRLKEIKIQINEMEDAKIVADNLNQPSVLKNLDDDYRKEIRRAIDRQDDSFKERKARLCKGLNEAIKNNIIQSRHGEELETRCKKIED